MIETHNGQNARIFSSDISIDESNLSDENDLSDNSVAMDQYFFRQRKISA